MCGRKTPSRRRMFKPRAEGSCLKQIGHRGVLQCEMNRKHLALLVAVTTAAGVGCISHHETVYRDVERMPVSFENDTAARLFYEALEHRRKSHGGNETRTEFQIPVVFDHEVKTVTGPSVAFNEAVRVADTNRDGKITEQEARIFSDLAR